MALYCGVTQSTCGAPDRLLKYRGRSMDVSVQPCQLHPGRPRGPCDEVVDPTKATHSTWLSMAISRYFSASVRTRSRSCSPRCTHRVTWRSWRPGARWLAPHWHGCTLLENGKRTKVKDTWPSQAARLKKDSPMSNTQAAPRKTSRLCLLCFGAWRRAHRAAPSVTPPLGQGQPQQRRVQGPAGPIHHRPNRAVHAPLQGPPYLER
jgi:hypothetical protein